jgi:hypothetical protein
MNSVTFFAVPVDTGITQVGVTAQPLLGETRSFLKNQAG